MPTVFLCYSRSDSPNAAVGVLSIALTCNKAQWPNEHDAVVVAAGPHSGVVRGAPETPSLPPYLSR
jgi:hypothetical protein